MKILVLNCGSSSIKYQLFDMVNKKRLAKGNVQKIGLIGTYIEHENDKNVKIRIDKQITDHQKGIEEILRLNINPEFGSIDKFEEINAIGHRVVHGGETFKDHALINDDVVRTIETLSDLAPLHNPQNVKGITSAQQILPRVPQVAVFDTAFHQTMPAYSYMYPLPYSCYINGESIDTSMGMTPVEGLMMGTRSGDVDAGAILHIMTTEDLGLQEMNNLINKQSGILGISGISFDMREIQQAIKKGGDRAKLAYDMFIYRIRKYIGAYAAAMNGVDAIIFTGGIGENDPDVRKDICTGFDYIGLKFDDFKNEGLKGKQELLSAPNSEVKVMVIPTNEELVIAEETYRIVKEI